jgi:hypothetical protein
LNTTAQPAETPQPQRTAIPARYDDAHIHLAYDRLVRTVEQRLHGRTSGIGRYSAQVVAARLAQRIVELTQAPYARHCVEALRRGEDPFAHKRTTLELGGLGVDAEDGTLRVSPRLMLTSLAFYLAWWARATFTVCLAPAASEHETARPATLVLGVGVESLFENGSDAGFVDYCERGPIEPLATAQRVIVQAVRPARSSRPERFTYHRFPLEALARTTRRTVGDRLRFAGVQLLGLGRFISLVLRRPLTVVLAQELAQQALVQFVTDREALGAVVITNSAFGKQPLWMRGEPRPYRVHMVWYSQNIIPFVYASDGVSADFPAYRHMKVDVSWVWTASFASYLKGLGAGAEFRVVGPILWQLPAASDVPDPNEIRLAVFDVTPMRMERVNASGVLNYYYNAPNMTAFVRGVADAAREVERATGKRVRLQLKHKRAGAPGVHDDDYQALVAGLAADGVLELVPPQTNMYALLAAASCALVVPYSSPAYVASHLRKPSVYYDASGQLTPSHLPDPLIDFAASPQALADAVLRALAVR